MEIGAAKDSPDAPLIVTGMHRSGTSWVARQLSKHGVFFGAHRDPNGEDFFFLRRNEWLLRQAGGAWDNPAALLQDLARPSHLKRAQARFAHDVNHWRFGRFTGLRHCLRYGPSSRPRGPWGWKDPRAIFTLPAWGEAFPSARLLYLRRNGVDVAASLRQREQQRKTKSANHKEREGPAPMARRVLALWRGYDFQARHLFPKQAFSLSSAFSLWETYVAQGERRFAQHPGPKLALSFEALANCEADALERLAEFSRVARPAPFIADWCAGAQPERAAAYQTDTELREFYKSVQHSTWMKAYGYSSLL